jgi:hypothetical protein
MHGGAYPSPEMGDGAASGDSAISTTHLRRLCPVEINHAANEVISTTLSLLNELFNPIVLWTMRALADERWFA